jgi:hypothetical protein
MATRPDPPESDRWTVELEIFSFSGREDGRLAEYGSRFTCGGTLSHRDTSATQVTFAYTETENRKACLRRMTVIVAPLPGDRLRFVERNRDRRVGLSVLESRY